MVTVTERAKARLKELLGTQTDDPSVALRLAPTSPGQFGIFPDRGRSDDETVQHQGSVVLLIGQEIAEAVHDTTIDCDEGETGRKFVIRKV
jgi:Fe-S cluster assembly iron-binding protein IscA